MRDQDSNRCRDISLIMHRMPSASTLLMCVMVPPTGAIASSLQVPLSAVQFKKEESDGVVRNSARVITEPLAHLLELFHTPYQRLLYALVTCCTTAAVACRHGSIVVQPV